jgi:rubredoxin
MFKQRKSADAVTRGYFVGCDCTGLKGRWQCENTGPSGGDRREAATVALQAGWSKIHNRWYCPDCQRDHLTPTPPKGQSFGA